MKISELTDKQIKAIIEGVDTEWAILNVPHRVVKIDPKVMAYCSSEWTMRHYPEVMADYNPEWMRKHYPALASNLSDRDLPPRITNFLAKTDLS